MNKSLKFATVNTLMLGGFGRFLAAFRVASVARPVGLQVLLASLFTALAAGCIGGQGNGQTSTPTVISPQHHTSPGGDDQASVPMFSQHDAPLGTDDGGKYFAGQLVLKEGCLRFDTTSSDEPDPRPLPLLIWPRVFTLSSDNVAVRIVDGLGRVVAHVGDHVRLSYAPVSYQEAQDQGLIRGVSEDCDGPYYLVGDDVTAFDPDNEPTELRLSDPDVLFLRQRTLITDFQELLTAGNYGVLVLDGQCLRLKQDVDAPLTTVKWPAGFSPHVHNGVVHVRNGAGRIIAQVGDEISMGGGYSTRYDDQECPGGVFSANSIKVLPDVEVYFPKQDGTLGTDQEMERFVGKLVLDGKCLEVDTAFRVRDRVIVPGGRRLVIWPDTFTLNLEEEAVGIVDATGHIVARVGDAVQFSAFSVTYQQALEHSGLQEIAPACGGPEWVIGEDFAAVPDSESR